MDRGGKPRVRWKTISLRGLLVIVLVIAVWLGWVVNKARRQREAVAALQKFGGFVHYDWEFVNGPVKVPQGNLLWMPSWGKFTPARKPWAPEWLRRAVGDEYFQSIAHVSLYVDIKKGVADATWVNMGPADDALCKLGTQTDVRTLQIGGQQVTDENLRYVGQMTGLEELSISWGHHLTDKGIVHLSRLRRLHIFQLDHSKITDASLEAIGKLTNLEELWLGGARFTDRGLEHLRGLTRLKSLMLWEGTQQLTDASLQSFARMTALEDLALRGSRFSDAGIATLRALKNLKTVFIGLSKDERDRRNRLQALLPGVKID
jgi:hypothetical protein